MRRAIRFSFESDDLRAEYRGRQASRGCQTWGSSPPEVGSAALPGRLLSGQQAGLGGEVAQQLLGALEALAQGRGALVDVDPGLAVAGQGAGDVAPAHAAID